MIQGITDTRLDATGVRQCLALGERIRDIPFDIAFTSPLLRGCQTLALILSKKSIHDRPICVTDARIIEFDYGGGEGTHPAECLKNVYGKRPNPDPTDAETTASVEQRVASFFDEILSKFPDKRILVITHAGFLRVASRYFTGEPADRDYTKAPRFKNCEMAIFNPKSKQFMRKQ